MRDEVNDRNLHVYINRDTFFSGVFSGLEKWMAFDFIAGVIADYFPLSWMVCMWLTSLFSSVCLRAN